MDNIEKKVKELMSNNVSRKLLKNAILSDSEFISDIAKEVFALPAQTVGLLGPGSIADFFRSDWVKET